MPARPLEDTTRTPFTPQVKILKREPNANNASTTNRSVYYVQAANLREFSVLQSEKF